MPHQRLEQREAERRLHAQPALQVPDRQLSSADEDMCADFEAGSEPQIQLCTIIQFVRKGLELALPS